MKYDSKVSTLEEWDDIDQVTVDKLHGILIAYEMRMGLNESSRKEETFKASYKKQLENLDDEEALFISKLHRGTKKYKGKIPLKYFNYGRIGKFSNKCPYQKQEEGDHEEYCYYKCKAMDKMKFNKKKENFYYKEDSDDEIEDA